MQSGCAGVPEGLPVTDGDLCWVLFACLDPCIWDQDVGNTFDLPFLFLKRSRHILGLQRGLPDRGYSNKIKASKTAVDWTGFSDTSDSTLKIP